MAPKIYIETEKWIIRDIVPKDLDGIFELDSDPMVHKYLGKKPIKSKEEASAIIDDIRKQYEKNGIGRSAIINKSDGDFVGWTGLKYEQNVRKDFSYYDLGYRLRQKYWGKGIASQTASIMLRYGFTTLKLKEISAGAHVENIASNRILQKIGMNYKETFLFDGAEHHWYSITRSEWLFSYSRP